MSLKSGDIRNLVLLHGKAVNVLRKVLSPTSKCEVRLKLDAAKWVLNKFYADKNEHDLGDKAAGAITSIAELFSRRYESEAKRLAAGEDPALVLFGRAYGNNRNVSAPN